MCPDNKMIKKLVKKFASSKKSITFAVPFFETTRNNFAEIAQLVEHDLAKVGVASSSLVFRSKRLTEMWGVFVFIPRKHPTKTGIPGIWSWRDAIARLQDRNRPIQVLERG